MSATVTDLFCGAGGSSVGAERAGGTLRFGINHWDRALETHATNFQHADHDEQNISALTTMQIRRYPDSDVLIASPECPNHSLAKGSKRRKPQHASLFDDGPAGDDEQERSRATMWDVCRFAEQKLDKGAPYKAIVVENVVDAFNWGPGDHGGLFDAWLMAMRSLGYEHEIVWLNSMFAGPVPQSRDRMYVVFWQRKMRAPDLRVEPVSWCPTCEKLVDGRQSFKRKHRGRDWGRYGPQYLYKCPECLGTVLPGAHPAIDAVDLTLPAPLIGERSKPLAQKSRDRIKRGLQRVLNEPFAIRVSHSGNPRPLTLPLVTLTAKQDMAVVVPQAGNTFERTPGNRARDASKRPMDTVHATLDRAVVVPPGQGAEVDAETSPGPTQTTTTRAALVVANREHNVPRVADEEPTHPVLTGSQQAVVVRNNDDHAGEQTTPTHEPVRTLTAGCHQSVVVPYRKGRGRDADEEPAPTLTGKETLSLVVPQTRNARLRPVDRDVVNTLAAEGPPALIEVTDEDVDLCGYRMFELAEIAYAMQMHRSVDGSAEYVVLGNKRERMRQYGNAVTPPAMELLLTRILEAMDA